MIELLLTGRPFPAEKEIFDRYARSVLMLETPNLEEIAKAIWQRQRNALDPTAISNTKWRDQSVPQKFWDEFILDAHAVLLLLLEKHAEYQGRQ